VQSWEGGQMMFLIKDMNKCILPEEKKKTNVDNIVKYIEQRFGYYDRYAFKFMICEAFNFIHVLLQIKMTDFFLQGEFLMYGYNMIVGGRFDISPTGRVFPKMAKCTFNRFGPSGDVQSYDNLCLLPLNILNEKIYFFVWLLFGVLLVVSALALVYRIAVIAVSPAR
jgi:hypothetical protein